MKAIFIITGLPTSGKTTVITTMNNLFTQFHNIYYYKLLDEKIKHLSPKDPTERQLYYLTKIRELLLQSSIVPDYIIDKIKRTDNDNTIFFIECDNPKDIIFIRRAFPRKVKVIYINKKDRFESTFLTLNDFVYDYKIENDGNMATFRDNIYAFINANITKKYKIKDMMSDITIKFK